MSPSTPQDTIRALTRTPPAEAVATGYTDRHSPFEPGAGTGTGGVSEGVLHASERAAPMTLGSGSEPELEPEPTQELSSVASANNELASANASSNLNPSRSRSQSPAQGGTAQRLSQSAPPASASLANETSQFGDLNRASEHELEMAKARMSAGFEATRLRPGDAGYQYDVRVEFAPAGEDAGSWDDESDWDD